MIAMLRTQAAHPPAASAAGTLSRREEDGHGLHELASRLTSPDAQLLHGNGSARQTGSLGRRAIQAKRVGSAADNALEREADRVADQVVGMSDSDGRLLHAASVAGTIHRLAVRSDSGLVAPPIVDDALSDQGLPLDAPTRAFFEPRFGHDFGRVRIHADQRAAASARAVGAYAYTAGHDIVFNRGRYAPQSTEGQALLAHELAHVLQQSGTDGAASTRSGSRTIQRKVAPDATKEDISPELLRSLKTDHGGQEATLPLTPGVLAWLAALRSGDSNPDDANPDAGISDRDPSYYPDKRHPGEAFQWGEMDLRAVDVSDVRQGYLGDCYFMALLAAIAQARPDAIERMIRSNDDGTFTVSFFGPDGKQVEQIVEPTFPSYPGSGNPTYAKFGDESDAFPKELWPMLIEKAWMQAKGGWMKIEGSKTSTKEHAIAMTGSDAETVALPGKLSDEALFKRLEEDYAAKQPVTFFSPKSPEGGKDKSKISGVHANHTYALWNVKKSAKTADLYNPWGEDHLLDKGMGFLRNNFRHVVFFKLGGKRPAATASGPTKEEQVATEAVPQEILKGSGYDVIVREFEQELPTRTAQWSVRDSVQRHGERLWKHSIERAQDPAAADTDDRPLYWARLRSDAILRAFSPAGFQLTPVEKQLLVDILEAASRGRMDIVFPDRKPDGERRVLISGFDPFGFQGGDSRRTANPSGAAVLALDGVMVSAASGDTIGRVEGVIFPVRFADFDRGMVETTFRPYLAKGKQSVDMIMTISQGGSTLDPKAPEAEQSKAFELERYAGRRRSTAAPDNAGILAVKSGELKEGKRMGAGPEFLESTLPRREMVGREETPDETTKTQTASGTAIEGSGGGYLSNEVFYRTALLRRDEKSSVPMGHLHVPKPPASTGTPESEKANAGLRDLIVQWVKKLIAAALATMGKKK